MDLVSITETVNFKNPIYGEGVLTEGRTYYTYSQFARETARRGLGRIIEKNGLAVTHFRPSHLSGPESIKKILLMFAGGLGDAVTIGTVLPEVMRKHSIAFDICGDRIKWDAIFKPMGLDAEYVPYPPDMETLSHYDAVLTDVSEFFHSNDGLKSSPIIQLCRGLGVNSQDLMPSYQIPEDMRNRLTLFPADRVRIGVNFDSNGLVKSYPERLQRILLQGLRRVGFDVYVLGVRRDQQERYDSGGIQDLRSKTTIPELSAILRHMDIVLGVDSFIIHLANLLGVSTTVLLSTTTPAYFEWHEHITCLASMLGCAPCFEVFNECPRGYPECHAFYHESIRPEIILRFVVKKVAALYSDVQTSC
ncbi:MAG: hypothetical protein JW896_11635 [Deltaproteobacteria bacterium]|nr:hypothetical protein [Deltaproteobacteria bacterium]